MRLWTSATSLLLASQLPWCVLGGRRLVALGQRELVGRRASAYAAAAVESIIDRRQSTGTTSDTTTWNQQTSAACSSAMSSLNGVASNPAGIASCYNIPYLDNATGIFEADLRLFTIASPTDAFAGIPPQNVTVGLQYFGASVQTIDPSQLTARGAESSLKSWPVNELHDLAKRQATLPTMTQMYAFKGQINPDIVMSNMTDSELQSLLMPVVTLSASTPSGTVANTTLSSNEAAFLTGVFSRATNSSATNPSATNSSAINSPTAQPFSLPGTRILIFPVGGVITSVWAVAFIATVSYGTVGRIKFRDSYRRRVVMVANNRAAARAAARVRGEGMTMTKNFV